MSSREILPRNSHVRSRASWLLWAAAEQRLCDRLWPFKGPPPAPLPTSSLLAPSAASPGQRPGHCPASVGRRPPPRHVAHELDSPWSPRHPTCLPSPGHTLRRHGAACQPQRAWEKHGPPSACLITWRFTDCPRAPPPPWGRGITHPTAVPGSPAFTLAPAAAHVRPASLSRPPEARSTVTTPLAPRHSLHLRGSAGGRPRTDEAGAHPSPAPTVHQLGVVLLQLLHDVHHHGQEGLVPRVPCGETRSLHHRPRQQEQAAPSNPSASTRAGGPRACSPVPNDRGRRCHGRFPKTR